MESSQNDSPTADSIAYLESQGVATDDEDEDDIHFCKKCKQVFKKLEAYLEHKVKHDKFKVAYNRAPGDRRMVLPTLKKKETAVKGEATAVEAGSDQTADTPARPRKRRKKKSPPVDIQLITERNTYICTTCDRKFSREASLKWHVQYDHKKTEEGESEEEEEEDKGTSTAEAEDDHDLNFKVKEPPAKRVHLNGDDDRPYKCEICGLGFKEVPVLKTHMLTHSNVRQHKCTYSDCPYAFKTKGSLVRHMRRHTGERPYACESCGRSFAESGALTRHMRSRKPCTTKSDADLPRYGKKWTYVPNIPAVVSQEVKSGDDSAFVSMVPGDMVVVMTEGENGEQILAEAQVVSNNETVSSLGEEGLVEEGEAGESEVGELVAAADDPELTSTQCKVCREECLEVEALRAHLRLHLADIPFHCAFCHFSTEDRDDLRTHLQSRHLQQLKGIDPSILLPPSDNRPRRETPHSARDNTEAQTAVKQLLELPVTASGGEEEGQEMREMCSARLISHCPICNRVFRGSSYLKQHMKSHAGDRPHECPVCSKSFVTKDSLNKHLIVHTDERNYKCGVCSKLFKRIAHVREHLKIHSADRPFPCSFCDKCFKTNNALKVHVRTHSNCYPYECRVCHRHFREKGSMHRHMRTHTGERPFICARCGRGFAEHGTLNRHLKAKVQCVGYQRVEREESVGLHIQGEEDEGGANKGEATVLAEFSSVVADTQKYIVADELTDGDTQTTEYVVLHTDLATEGVQDVQIVTDSDIDPDAILSAVTGSDTFVVVREAGNQLRVIDSNTGLTLATMAGDTAPTPPLTLPSADPGGQSGVKEAAGKREEKVVVAGSGVGEEGGTVTVLADPSGHIILRQQQQQQGHTPLPPQHHASAQESVIVVSNIVDAITLQTAPQTADTITLGTTAETTDIALGTAAETITLGTTAETTDTITLGTAAETITLGTTAEATGITLGTMAETADSITLGTAEATDITLGTTTETITLGTTEIADSVTLGTTSETADTITLGSVAESHGSVPLQVTQLADAITLQQTTEAAVSSETGAPHSQDSVPLHTTDLQPHTITLGTTEHIALAAATTDAITLVTTSDTVDNVTTGVAAETGDSSGVGV